ncbi:hypothetical protein GGH95_004338, partial [Coemansia sp. RSA 1836]
MKFEQQLALKTIPSWAIYYLNYKKLKAVLYTDFEHTSNGPALANGTTTTSAEEPVEETKISGGDTSYDAFCALFLAEVGKVNTRYVEQESGAQEKLKALKTQWRADMAEQAAESWKADFIKLLRQLENLSDFTQCNITACRKILKKADKVAGQPMTLRLWPLVTNLRFAKSESDEALLHDARAVWRKRAATPVAAAAAVASPPESKMRRLTPAVATVSELDLASFPAGEISRVWVALAEDGMGLPIRVPVIIAKGAVEGPVVGITAALHGNELNGIPLIHRLFDEVSPAKLHGTLVAVPVANSPGFLLSQRGYTDGTDLNRVMPGKPNGSSPQVYAYNLMHRIIRHFEYLLDMHTASRGRV